MEQDLANYQESCFAYVTKLQEVNEKKKFELVEIVSGCHVLL